MKLTYAKATKLKSPDALLTIKEFSGMCGVEQSVLRYWDEIGLFPPAARNDETGYRSYSPQQIILINYIKVLGSLGIPLRTIAEISEGRSPQTLLRLMAKQSAALDTELHRLQAAQSTIHILSGFFQEGAGVANPGEITQQTLDDVPIVLGPANSKPWKDANFYEGFLRYCDFANANLVNLNNPVGGYYESMESYLAMPSVPTCFFSVDPRGKHLRPAGEYLVCYTQGYYGQMEDTPQRMSEYAKEQGVSLKGPVYIVYLLSEICEADPSNYLAKVCAAIEPQPADLR